MRGGKQLGWVGILLVLASCGKHDANAVDPDGPWCLQHTIT